MLVFLWLVYLLCLRSRRAEAAMLAGFPFYLLCPWSSRFEHTMQVLLLFSTWSIRAEHAIVSLSSFCPLIVHRKQQVQTCIVFHHETEMYFSNLHAAATCLEEPWSALKWRIETRRIRPCLTPRQNIQPQDQACSSKTKHATARTSTQQQEQVCERKTKHAAVRSGTQQQDQAWTSMQRKIFSSFPMHFRFEELTRHCNLVQPSPPPSPPSHS